MADLKFQTVPAPYAGLNTVSPPGKCPEGTGPLVRNFLTHIPGKLAIRGPLTKSPNAPVKVSGVVTGTNILTGAWKFNDRLLLGFLEKSSSANVPPWVAPYWRLTNEANLARSLTSLVYINLTAGTATKITAGSGYTAPRNEGARLEKYVYGLAFYASEKSNVNGNYQAVSKLLRWDGTAAEPTAYEHAPKGGQAVKSYLNRIFVLGGKDPTVGQHVYVGEGTSSGGGETPYYSTIKIPSEDGPSWLKVGTELWWKNLKGETHSDTIKAIEIIKSGLGHYTTTEYKAEMALEKLSGTEEGIKFYAVRPDTGVELNALYWSDQGGPVKDEIASWEDDVSGLVNKAIIGDDDQNDFGVALAVVNQSLIIFKRNSIWALYGYSPATFQLKNLTTERGCIDPSSVLEVDGGVYFFSQNGFEFFDGSQFKTVDGAIANVTRPAARYHAGEKGVHSNVEDFGRISTTYIGNEYLMLAMVGQNPETGAGAPGSINAFSFLLHMPTGNWSEFRTEAWSSTGMPCYVDSAASIPWAWDGSWINPLTFVSNPAAAEITVGRGQLDENHETGDDVNIESKFWTDRIPLASPGYTSQLHRYMLDYKFPNESTDAAAKAGWKVTLYNEKSTTPIFSNEQLPGQGESEFTSPFQGPGLSSYLNGRRWEKDVFNEAIDVRLEVKNDTTVEVKQGEVYDSTFEFLVSRQRRST